MDRDTLITALQIALLANVAVIAFALAGLRGIRRSREAAVDGDPRSSAEAGGHPSADGPVAYPAAAMDPPRSGSSATAPPGPPAEPEPVAPAMAAVPGPASPSVAAEPPPSGISEGLRSRREWTAAVSSEHRRQERHRRPTSVIVAELDGLERLARSLGPEMADQIVEPTALVVRSRLRASDVVGRFGGNDLRILLPETDGSGAVTVAARVRSAADAWLEAGGVAIRLAIGSASSDGGAPVVDLEAAAAIAAREDRLGQRPSSRA